MKKQKISLKTRWRYFKEMLSGIPNEDPNCPAFHTWKNYDDWDYCCRLGGFKKDMCYPCKLRFLPNSIIKIILEIREEARDREIDEMLKRL